MGRQYFHTYRSLHCDLQLAVVSLRDRNLILVLTLLLRNHFFIQIWIGFVVMWTPPYFSRYFVHELIHYDTHFVSQSNVLFRGLKRRLLVYATILIHQNCSLRKNSVSHWVVIQSKLYHDFYVINLSRVFCLAFFLS